MDSNDMIKMLCGQVHDIHKWCAECSALEPEPRPQYSFGALPPAELEYQNGMTSAQIAKIHEIERERDDLKAELVTYKYEAMGHINELERNLATNEEREREIMTDLFNLGVLLAAAKKTIVELKEDRK